MPDREKLLDKLRKVLTMAERGEPGEKKNAKAKLRELMNKYHITWEDLQKEIIQEKIEYHFGYRDKFEKIILFQAYSYVTQTGTSIKYWEKGKRVYFLLTPIEKIELENYWKYYKRLWRDEMENILSAFIHKHRIWGPPSEEKKESKPLTHEELMRMAQLICSMKASEYISTRRMIGDG